MPGISKGFQFWQPAPRLSNAFMAGTSPNPTMSPHARKQAPVTLKYQWREKKGKEGGGGGRNLAEETSW